MAAGTLGFGTTATAGAGATAFASRGGSGEGSRSGVSLISLMSSLSLVLGVLRADELVAAPRDVFARLGGHLGLLHLAEERVAGASLGVALGSGDFGCHPALQRAANRRRSSSRRLHLRSVARGPLASKAEHGWRAFKLLLVLL